MSLRTVRRIGENRENLHVCEFTDRTGGDGNGRAVRAAVLSGLELAGRAGTATVRAAPRARDVEES